MEKQIKCYTLGFEVTRKCNMTCQHCLRGNAQNKDISPAIIDAVLNQDIETFNLLFTGGEPSMNSSAVKYIVDGLIARMKIPYSFFLATNGKEYSSEMVEALINLYAHIIAADGEPESSSLALSKDKFHEGLFDINEQRYRALAFFSDCKFTDFNEVNILNEGRAKNENIGTKNTPFETISPIEFTTSFIDIDNTLYINVKGDVLIGCDYSYANQNKLKIGNVLEKPLFDILESVLLKKGFEQNEDEKTEDYSNTKIA